MPALLLLLLSQTELSVKAGAPYGGAISSIVWHGKEFVDSFDHGRELQSALSFDGYGECYNPTEGGSEIDGSKLTTTSELLSSRTTSTTLESRTDMAFWMIPGQKYLRDCGSRKGVRVARNQLLKAGYILEKKVTLRGRNLLFDLNFHVPNPHESGTFEVLTGYMPEAFATPLILKNGTLEPISWGPGEQRYPVVLSTPDRQSAMGASCEDDNGKITYGRFEFFNQHVVKWNAVNRKTNIAPGDYRYRCFVAIGTAEDVRAALSKPE